MDYREPLVPNAPEPLCKGDGPFRPNVAALIVRQTPSGPHLLLGERFDMPGAWQWPQGGIDPGETPEIGLFREVEEEIGVSELEILYRFPFLLRYRFPQGLGKKFHPRIGQEQYYFITALKPKAAPDLMRATTPEFRKLRWVPLPRASEAFVWFKRPVCEAALAHALEVLPKLALPMSLGTVP